jgi:hypothetical protein
MYRKISEKGMIGGLPVINCHAADAGGGYQGKQNCIRAVAHKLTTLFYNIEKKSINHSIDCFLYLRKCISIYLLLTFSFNKTRGRNGK